VSASGGAEGSQHNHTSSPPSGQTAPHPPPAPWGGAQPPGGFEDGKPAGGLEREGAHVAELGPVALADAWLSRSLLVYLDAVEANAGKVVESLRKGGGRLDVTGVDRRRDQGQNRARALKALGWLALALGFGLQMVAVWLTKHPA
jgi:hypothetical protein